MRIKDLLALVGLHTFYYPDLAASLSLLFFDNNKPSSVFYLKRSRALSRLFKSCLKAVIVVLVAPGRTAPQTLEAPSVLLCALVATSCAMRGVPCAV